MTTKKKVLAGAVAACMVAVIASATLAYLTDTDYADNTFTVGNISIELIEEQRKADGSGLEDFKQDKKLFPIVGSAQGDKDEFGQPVAKNYVDKMITVKNTSKNDAYVRTYFAIPTALDDGYESFNAGKNTLHFNFGNKMVDGQLVSTFGTDWDWERADGQWNYFETILDDGVRYNVYYADYKEILPAGETTTQCVSGVYLDKSVNFDKEGDMWAFGKELTTQLDWSKGITCPVFTVAVQAEGFANADAAMDEAFGAGYNPWGTETFYPIGK